MRDDEREDRADEGDVGGEEHDEGGERLAGDERDDDDRDGDDDRGGHDDRDGETEDDDDRDGGTEDDHVEEERGAKRDKRSKWKFRLWVATASFTALLLTAMTSAWLVWHAVNGGPLLSEPQARAVIAVARYPGLVGEVIRQTLEAGGDPKELLCLRSETEKPSWVQRFPAPADPGYLLFAGIDPERRHATISLIRIADGAEVARWDPDWSSIYESVSDKRWRDVGAKSRAACYHPLLLADGSLVCLWDQVAMFKLPACEGKPTWVLDEQVHHSLELALDGKSLWTPGITTDAFPDNPWLAEHMRDDALVRVSLQDGKVLEKTSVTRLFVDNGLGVLILGGGGFVDDPIHLNEISEARHDTKYWKAGDLLVSTRHNNTVLLYRPSSKRIIWHKQGPWMRQHAALFVDDHRISVFGNQTCYCQGRDKEAFPDASEHNRVFVYDFDTDAVTEPWDALLEQARPVTLSGGRSRVLPDGGLFVEESNNCRLLRFSKDALLWSRAAPYNEEYFSGTYWSRYLTAAEAEQPLRALQASAACQDALAK